ncbi:DUF5661 family protein [Candidatus Omnitrophota bacterium]
MGYAENYEGGGKKEVLKKVEEAKYASDALIDKVAKKLDIDFNKVDKREFARGMVVELEHGTKNPATDVTGDDPILTAKIVLAHLNEIPDYYTLLDEMEEKAKKESEGKEEVE